MFENKRNNMYFYNIKQKISEIAVIVNLIKKGSLYQLKTRMTTPIKERSTN